MSEVFAPSAFKKDQLLKLVNEEFLFQDNFESINCVSTQDNVKDKSMFFCDSVDEDRYKFLASLDVSSALMICTSSEFSFDNISTIISNNPRVTYAKIVNELFSYDRDFFIGSIDPINIPKSTSVFPGTFIHHTSSIGKNTVIYPNVSIGPNCQIGDNVIIKPSSVIGFSGFGTIKDKKKLNHHLPHVGGVVVEDDVEIGSLTTVCAGTINPTIIGQNVKIDDHVHIGHNAIVKKGSIITACAIVAGSVHVSENSWIGLNVTTKEGIELGKDSLLGMGAVVLKNVDQGATMIGNPAKPLIKKPKSEE